MIFICSLGMNVYHCCGKQILSHFCFTLMSIVAKICFFSHKGGCGLGLNALPKLARLFGRVGVEPELAVSRWSARWS